MAMRSLLQAVCAVTLGVCGVAHATLISIDANDFAAETDVSSATFGVTMSAMGYAYSYTDSSGLAVYTPIRTGPVYSHALNESLCSFEYGPPGTSCPATGDQVLSPAAGRDVTFNEAGWEMSYGEPGPPCLGPCINRTGSDSLLRVDFATPTNYVDTLGLEIGGDFPGIWAYDAAGDLVGSCAGGVDDYCTSASYIGSTADWLQLSVSAATSDISTVLISGIGNTLPFERVRYVPEPATLGLMCIGLAGIGFGRRRRKNYRA